MHRASKGVCVQESMAKVNTCSESSPSLPSVPWYPCSHCVLAFRSLLPSGNTRTKFSWPLSWPHLPPQTQQHHCLLSKTSLHPLLLLLLLLALLLHLLPLPLFPPLRRLPLLLLPPPLSLPLPLPLPRPPLLSSVPPYCSELMGVCSPPLSSRTEQPSNQRSGQCACLSENPIVRCRKPPSQIMISGIVLFLPVSCHPQLQSDLFSLASSKTRH